ncbi:MAG: MFS transporter [Granulosicoccus sp.]
MIIRIMSRARSTLIVFVLWFAGLSAANQFAKVGLFLPELSSLYPNATAYHGFLLSTISVVGALLGLTAGTLALHIGLRRLLISGLLLAATISIVQSLQLPLWLLMATRIVEGFAHLAIVVSAPTLIATISSQKYTPAAMTLWGTFFGVSYALTAWLGFPLVATHGIHSLFLAHGLITTLIAILVFLLVPVKVAHNNQRASRLSISQIIEKHVSTWTSASISAPAFGWLFYTITFVALLAVLPGLMRPEDRSVAGTLLPLASIFCSMFFGVILTRLFSAVTVVCLGFTLSFFLASLLLFIPVTPLPCIALFASLGLVQGASFAAVPQLNKKPSEQTLANGALAQAGNIGNFCGTPLLLWSLSAGGLAAMIALVMACYVAAIGIHLHLFFRRRLLGG